MESLLSRREPVDLAKATTGSDVILIGDDHTQPEIKVFLMHQLKTLGGLGYRCLAVEMLPARFQDSLDRWTEPDQVKVRQHLARFWGEKGPGVVESLFDLIATAKRERLRVMALDPDDAPSMDRDDVNPHWVECIQRCRIGTNGLKMIVFGGSSHFQAQPRSAYSLLKNSGVSCTVLEFSGLEKPGSVDLNLKTAELLGREAPLTLQLTAEAQRRGLHGSYMLHGNSEASVARWIISMDPAVQVASLSTLK